MGQLLFSAQVNDRKIFNAENALRISEAKARAIVETAVDSIISIDDRGLVQTLNPAAKRMFGYDSPEVIGRNVKMLMPHPYVHEHDQYLCSYLTTGVKKIIGCGREVVGKRKDGSTFPMELSVSEVAPTKYDLLIHVTRHIHKPDACFTPNDNHLAPAPA